MIRDTLIVTTHRTWIFDDLAAGAPAAGLRAVHDLGVDLPKVDPQRIAAWWLPLEHAADVQAAGVDVPFVSCGPNWLAALDPAVTGRRITATSLAAAAGSVLFAGKAGVVKLAEAKHPALPCTRTDDIAATATAAARAGIPLPARLEISDRWIPGVCCEHRHFVAAEVTAAACYLHGDDAWNAETFQPCTEHAAVARRLADAVVATAPCAPGFTLDVAVTVGGHAFVLEANPAFSSAPYDADATGVIAALRASIDWHGRQGQWRWQPDITVTERQPRLRPAPSATAGPGDGR